MTVTEKAAYIKGLAEGLGIDNDTKEGKVINAIIDLLGDITVDLEDAQDACAMLVEQIDAVDEDLADLEEVIYGDDEEDYDECDGDCDCCDGCDDELYEVECPACHDIIYIDDTMLDEGQITCPNCGKTLEFEIDFDESEAEEN